MGSEHYCLRWNNHQSNLLGVFSQLLQDESLVDVTLACAEGHSIRAHKVVLSACSSYFQTLFVDHPNRHPIVILKDVRFVELQTLIEFMYKGEVNVEYCQLSALLKTAESLKVKGLAEMTNLGSQESRDDRGGDTSQDAPDTPPPPPPPPESAPKRPAPEDRSPSPPPTPTRARRDSPFEDEDRRTPDMESLALAGPSDMSLANNSASCNLPPTPATAALMLATSRLPSPHASDPIGLPGPSCMLPVQQVPLSLKKEVVDWDRNMADDKSTTGESSSDYRQLHEPDTLLVEGRYGPSCALSTTRLPGSTPSSRSSTPFQFPFPPFGGGFSPGLEGFGEGPSRQACSILGLLQQQGLIGSPPSEESVFRCSVCNAAFPSAWLLDQHASLQHAAPPSDGEAPDDKPFKCEQCGQSYRYRSAYLKHREQNHRARLPADKLFTCDVCGMQFRYLKSFKKHRLNHALEKLHSRSPSDLDLYGGRMMALMARGRGEVSGRVTAPPTAPAPDGGSDQVSSSNEAVVPGPSPSIDCTRAASAPIPNTFYKFSMEDYYCNGSFGDSRRLGRDGEQDESIDSLALALSMASGGGGDAFRSAQEVSLLNLLRMDAAERQRERRFSCPFCGKCVRSKENLKLHVRKHTGERPFVCLFCGRAFGGKSDLTRHLRIHTGERPYHCEMCGKCFARADYLSKHLTTHIHHSQR